MKSMKSYSHEAGFSVVESLLVVIILGILGFTGYFVYHAQHSTNKTLRDTNKVGQSTAASSQKRNYLVVKEWGVKIPLSSADASAYYVVNGSVQQSSSNPTNLTVYSTSTDALAGPAGVSCKGEYVAYLLRLPKDDPRWQPSTSVDDGNVFPIYEQRTVIGNYKYAVDTHKEYGPTCFETSTSGSYTPDPATSQKFGAVVTAFTQDFKKIMAD